MSPPLPPVTPGRLDLAYLREVVGTDSPLILEIGAHDGTNTRQLLSRFPGALLFAFEPDPRAIRKFKARVSDPRAQLAEIAIGAADGAAEFHVSTGVPPHVPPEERAQYAEGWDQSGSLRTPKAHAAVWPWVKFERTITVPVRRLDSWAREIGLDGPVDLIWADMQGAEGDLIAGGAATLAMTRYLYTEYSNDEWYEGQPTLAQLLDLLPSFRVLRRYAMDVLLENKASSERPRG